ncbi:GFA family protein [Paenirhodobacter sp.]|uniref:GFA family protein n=1 Tax=Paenirhodobacter sp. TaxID=1965326 RepID=UPI003B3E2D4E
MTDPMKEAWRDLPAFTGGCQCGATRYHVAAGRAYASICHCRMCQRATGGAFAALLVLDEARVTWEGTPGVFASSNIAERGFCPACGTPLFYRASGLIEVTAGSLPPAIPFEPVVQFGIESRMHWLDTLALPGVETTECDVISHQAPE